MKKEQLRKLLIKTLDESIVPYEKWSNRDTPSAHEKCAKMRMYLKAGCRFKIVKYYDEEEIPLEEMKEHLDKNETIYISIFHYNFEDEGSWHTGYAPSVRKVKETK